MTTKNTVAEKEARKGAEHASAKQQVQRDHQERIKELAKPREERGR